MPKLKDILLADQIVEDTKVSGECLVIEREGGELAMELLKRAPITIYLMSPTPRKIIEDRIKDVQDRIFIKNYNPENLSLINESVNLVVANEIFHLTPDPVVLIKEIYRVLKVGGIGYVVDVRKDAPKDVVNTLAKTFEDPKQFINAVNSSYTLDEASSILEKSGINGKVGVMSYSSFVIEKNFDKILESEVLEPRAPEVLLKIFIRKEK